MYRIIFAMFLISPASVLAGSHQAVDPQVSSAIIAEISKNIKINPITNVAFSRVFNANLYQVQTGMQGSGVGGYYIEVNGQIKPVRDGTGQEYLDYAALIKPEFKIGSRIDLLDLREAMLFFAGGSPPSPDVPKYGKYKQIWTVITGTFFDDYSGYVLWRKPGGSFDRLEYQLKIPRDELTDAK